MNLPERVANLDELPTPALVIDAVVARNNIRRLADYASKHRIGLRPHTKTHKNRVIAKLQIEAGAIGLTFAKVGEAEQLQTESTICWWRIPRWIAPAANASRNLQKRGRFALQQIARSALKRLLQRQRMPEAQSGCS